MGWLGIIVWPLLLVAGVTAYILLAFELRRRMKWTVDIGVYGIAIITIGGAILVQML